MFEIGNSLREARLRQGLDLARVEDDTKIRAKYLQALEDERFEVLPVGDLRQGVPAHVRRVSRPRRAALRGRVQLALRERGGAGRRRPSRPASARAGRAESSYVVARSPASWPWPFSSWSRSRSPRSEPGGGTAAVASDDDRDLRRLHAGREREPGAARARRGAGRPLGDRAARRARPARSSSRGRSSGARRQVFEAKRLWIEFADQPVSNLERLRERLARGRGARRGRPRRHGAGRSQRSRLTGRPRATVLLTGSELVRGAIRDANGAVPRARADPARDRAVAVAPRRRPAGGARGARCGRVSRPTSASSPAVSARRTTTARSSSSREATGRELRRRRGARTRDRGRRPRGGGAPRASVRGSRDRASASRPRSRRARFRSASPGRRPRSSSSTTAASP